MDIQMALRYIHLFNIIKISKTVFEVRMTAKECASFSFFHKSLENVASILPAVKMPISVPRTNRSCQWFYTECFLFQFMWAKLFFHFYVYEIRFSEGLYHDWKYFDLFWRQIHFYLRFCLAHIIICLANRKKQWDMPCCIQRDQASCKEQWKALIFH